MYFISGPPLIEVGVGQIMYFISYLHIYFYFLELFLYKVGSQTRLDLDVMESSEAKRGSFF